VKKAREARNAPENMRKLSKRVAARVGRLFSEAVYEGFGPNGEAFYINVLTDNKNRTVAEDQKFFSKFGGSLRSGIQHIFFSPIRTNPVFNYGYR